MTDTKRILEEVGIKTMFLVWSHPQGSHRSQFFSETLGMNLQYVYFIRRRGGFYAALKYPIQALQTMWILFRKRPRLVFIQDPPTLAAFVVWLCGFILNLDFIIDTHTQRHELVDYPFLYGMRRFLAKRALTNIITNEYLKSRVEEWEAIATIMEDPPLPIVDKVQAKYLSDAFNVVWVNVGAVDEPREIFFEAAQQLPNIRFYVTSDYERNAELQAYKKSASENVIFTRHLPDDEYYQLLKSADVVLTMTTRNHTLQQGACEAMWLGRPVITSDWGMLRQYFTQGALFVDNTVDSLKNAVLEMRQNHTQYVEEIAELDELRRADWEKQVAELMDIIKSKI